MHMYIYIYVYVYTNISQVFLVPLRFFLAPVGDQRLFGSWEHQLSSPGHEPSPGQTNMGLWGYPEQLFKS